MVNDEENEGFESLFFWRNGLRQIDELVRSVTSSSKQRGISVDLNKADIQKRAAFIEAWKNTYEVYVWLWAEAELRLANAYITKLDTNSTSVTIDPEKIVDNPPKEDIMKLAKQYASNKLKLQDIHWFLAERQYVLEKIKSRM